MSRALALGLALLLLPAMAAASEGGSGHHVPGGMATLIDLAPTKPGFVVEAMYLHYAADASRSLPVAQRVAAGLDVQLDSLLLGALYTFEPKLLGPATRPAPSCPGCGWWQRPRSRLGWEAYPGATRSRTSATSWTRPASAAGCW